MSRAVMIVPELNLGPVAHKYYKQMQTTIPDRAIILAKGHRSGYSFREHIKRWICHRAGPNQLSARLTAGARGWRLVYRVRLQGLQGPSTGSVYRVSLKGQPVSGADSSGAGREQGALPTRQPGVHSPPPRQTSEWTPKDRQRENGIR